jgi:hypothetical protein
MYMSGEQHALTGHEGQAEEDEVVVEEPSPAAGIRIPAAAGVAISLAVAVTVVVGVLPGLIQHPAREAVPILVEARP